MDVLKIEGEVEDPKAEVENVDCCAGDGVDPNGLGLDCGAPKIELAGAEPEFPNVEVPKAEVFGANGLVAVVEENGFDAFDWPNADGEEKRFGCCCCCVLFVLNPIPPEDWPAGFGPPETKQNK